MILSREVDGAVMYIPLAFGVATALAVLIYWYDSTV